MYIGACCVFRIHIYIYIYIYIYIHGIYIYTYSYLYPIYISRGMENKILQEHQPQLRGSNLCDQWELYIYIFTSVDDTRVDTWWCSIISHPLCCISGILSGLESVTSEDLPSTKWWTNMLVAPLLPNPHIQVAHPKTIPITNHPQLVVPYAYPRMESRKSFPFLIIGDGSYLWYFFGEILTWFHNYLHMIPKAWVYIIYTYIYIYT